MLEQRLTGRLRVPTSPRFPEREIARILKQVVKEAVDKFQALEWALQGIGCDGKPTLTPLNGGAGCCTSCPPGQALVLVNRQNGMPTQVTTNLPRQLSGTQGYSDVSISVSSGLFGAAAAVLSLAERRRFVDSSGDLYAADGSALGSAPSYFKGPAYHIALTASPSVGVFSTYRATPGTAVTLTAAAAGGTAPYTYAWDFDDGGTATGATVSHTWAAPGFYVPVVVAVDSAGTPVTASVAFYVHVVAQGSPAAAGAVIIPPRRDSLYSATGGDPWRYRLLGEGEDNWQVYDGSTGYYIGYWDLVPITGVGTGWGSWDQEDFAYTGGPVTKNCLAPGIYPGSSWDGCLKSSDVLFGVEVKPPAFTDTRAVVRAKDIAAPLQLSTVPLDKVLWEAGYASITPERNCCAAADGSFWAQEGHRGYLGIPAHWPRRMTRFAWDGTTLTQAEEVTLAGSWTERRVWVEFARLT